MKRLPGHSSTRRRAGGFSLVSTLFILVVLAALGSYMVRLNVTQQTTTTLSLQSVRAWYAATSGMEWAVYQVDNGGSCPTVPSSFTAEGFTITVTACSAYPVSEGADNYTLYDIQVTARRGSFGSVDYVSRKLRASVKGS